MIGKGVSPVPPHPGPLPKGEGEGQARLSHIGRTRKLVERPAWLPLLWGDGGGKGERGRRTDPAAHYVFGTCETEPQFLAALDKNVRAPIIQRRRVLSGRQNCPTERIQNWLLAPVDDLCKAESMRMTQTGWSLFALRFAK